MMGSRGAWANSTGSAIGGKYVRTTRFVSIGSLTSGQVTLPSNATVVLDDFGGTVDAVVTQISGGKPTQLPALTAAGAVVATTFDSSGNWVFSGTPVSYPVAIVYRVQQTLNNYDSSSSDIWAESEFHSVLPIADGGTGNTTGTAALATAPAAGSAHGAITLDGSGNFQSVAPGAAGGFMRSNGTDFVRAGISGSDVPVLAPISGNLATMAATTGSDGQMFWNTTYKAMFVWTVDGWDLFHVDARYGFKLAWEEFTGQDRIGTLDWSNAAQTAGNLLNPGIYSIANATASSVVRIGGQLNAIQLGTMDIYLETLIMIPTLSNGTDNTTFVFGLNDGSVYDAHGACTDGAYFSLDYATDQTHWLTNTTNNTSNTQKISTTVPSANTWYRLVIAVIGGTSASFFVNQSPFSGTAITAAHSTNLPTGAGRQTGINYCIHKVLGSGSQSLQVDYFKMYGFFNGQRVA